MFQNYLKVAWRNQWKRRIYSSVSILGLTVGITFTLLIGSFIWGELRVNTTLRHADRQYIVRSKWKQPDMGYEDATLAPLGETLKEQYPGLVANYYHFDVLTTAVSNGNTHFVREVAEAGDPTMLTMYGFEMLSGDARTALKTPDSVVLTAENARRYFGRTDVLGRVLQLSNYTGGKQAFTVTGVLKSIPKNSVTYLWDLPVNIFIPLNSLRGRTDAAGWTTWNLPTYIELKEGITKEDLTKPIQKLMAAYAPKEARENLSVYLTPLTDYYWDFNNGIVRKTIYSLLAIGVLILLMAIVNFTTITIGSSSARIREIGVRKVLGGPKRSIVYQFLAESTLLVTVATLLSLLFYELFRPLFADVSGKQLDALWRMSPWFFALSMLLTLLIGALSGLYPAFVLSSLPSVDSLKGKLQSVQEGLLFRRILLTAQFSIALFVFCGAVVVSQQVAYFFTKDQGYNKESMLLVSLPRDWTAEGVARMETVRNEFARMAEVRDISISSSTPKAGASYVINLYRFGTDSTRAVPTTVLQTDEHFAKTYQVRVVAGHFYQSADSSQINDKVVLNEATIRALGYSSPEAAVGQQLQIQGYRPPITIAGVTNDFGFGSLKEKIKPLAISHVSGSAHLFSYLSIKLKTTRLTNSVAAIEARFHQLLPDAPFEFSFIDDALQQQYQSELQLKKTAQIASVLALIIVLLGVFGMVALSVARRTKEVGIRKVLGATTRSVVILFIKEFLLALSIALVIAMPVAFLLMRAWLQNFAYRIDISLLSFAGVGVLSVLTIGLLVSLQTIKAALMNPVTSLRSE